jgi:hypothetical protein
MKAFVPDPCVAVPDSLFALHGRYSRGDSIAVPAKHTEKFLADESGPVAGPEEFTLTPFPPLVWPTTRSDPGRCRRALMVPRYPLRHRTHRYRRTLGGPASRAPFAPFGNGGPASTPVSCATVITVW